MADGNKTEQATPKRRKKAREQGQIPRSHELQSIAAATAAAAVLAILAPSAPARWSLLYRETLLAAATGSIEPSGPVLFWLSAEVMRWFAPTLLAAAAGSLFAGLAQGGFNLAPNALALKFERFSPVAKLGQLFSAAGLSNMLKSLLPFSAIAWIAASILSASWSEMVDAASVGLSAFTGLVGSMIFALAWKSALVLLAWSAVDYFFMWKKIDSSLKMTKQEVREEYKETDGNPIIKQRLRQIRRLMRRAQSLKAASTATVVITNPTHFAVALRYENDMAAPQVVAKGRDLLAEKIKQLARDSGILLVENRPLAQALYKTVEVGDAIPAKLYQAVAEILVMVYRAQAELRQREAERRNRNASGHTAGGDPAARKETRP